MAGGLLYVVLRIGTSFRSRAPAAQRNPVNMPDDDAIVVA
jgi:hypothetical protein